MSFALNSLAVICAVLCLCAGCRRTQGSSAESAPKPATAPASASPASPPASSTTSLALDSAAHLRFTGKVNRGERFQKKLGVGLVFRLNPAAQSDSGRRIEILSDTVPLPEDFDCSGSVTPPAHGPNDLFLDKPDGWSPEKKPEWNVHQFNFVANPAECKIAWDLFNEEEYPSNKSDKEKEADEEKFGKILTGTGTLTIVDSRFGPPTASDEYGAVQWLTFEVDLRFPRPPKL